MPAEGGLQSHMKGWGCSAEIWNETPKREQLWQGKGLFDP